MAEVIQEYDVVVLGTGPGGEGAAMQAVKNGRSVAVVEREHAVGGNCTHRGTIPSKALRFAIFQMTEVNNNVLFREHGITANFMLPELRRRARSVIEAQIKMRTAFYDRNDIPIIRGQARFLDPHTIEATEEDGSRTTLRAKYVVIATGSRPYRPPEIDFNHPRVFDSDTILDVDFHVKSITIFGAGVIGCEYASMFRNLEIKVNLINTRDRLLDFLDEEIVDALSYHLRERGVIVRHRESFDRVETCDDGVILHLKSGKQLKTDVLLWAQGRTGNSDHLGLDVTGIVPDSRGNIPVNSNLQTIVPHIYGAGDVIGPPALASAAYNQGRYAASHLLCDGGNAEQCGPAPSLDIPAGIYTSPEISSLGKTERELTEAHVPYEVGHAHFKSIARAQITGQTTGMLKILFHRETLEVLGIHCFGANASEIIHIGQAIMAQPKPNNTLMYFINTTFNYPTMAEAYRVAALNGFNRLF
ncbi:Si-specific NAD(P)(+) transhydrogenase [Schlesneria paludicola]|uniref:Si-specific NAD(P)(+) transhydrogenase n=1 Tax=Schlesneria paludicola TaxID=360056 RepID=UPI00029A7B03|nr:Si-specific NAD(P)(+) transhydrogenase [Schlesneria paludicola]